MHVCRHLWRYGHTYFPFYSGRQKDGFGGWEYTIGSIAGFGAGMLAMLGEGYIKGKRSREQPSINHRSLEEATRPVSMGLDDDWWLLISMTDFALPLQQS